MRIEISMRKREYIRRFLKTKNPTLRQLTVQAIEDRLKKELKNMGLDQNLVCNRLEVDQLLSKVHSPSIVRNALGFLAQSQSRTYEQMTKEGTSRKTISKYSKVLRDAGISILSGDPESLATPTLD